MITITLEAQLKAHYGDKEKLRTQLNKYVSMYLKAPQTENVVNRINNFKSILNQLQSC